MSERDVLINLSRCRTFRSLARNLALGCEPGAYTTQIEKVRGHCVVMTLGKENLLSSNCTVCGAVVRRQEFETWASMTDRIQCNGCDAPVPADDSAADSGQFFSIKAVGEPPPDHLTVIAPTNGAELPLNGHLIK